MHTATATTVVTKVPATRGRTPNLESANSGDHSRPVKNSLMLTSAKNSAVGTASDKTMATVVPTDNTPHRASTALTTASP
jgi:hypothetical protein